MECYVIELVFLIQKLRNVMVVMSLYNIVMFVQIKLIAISA